MLTVHAAHDVDVFRSSATIGSAGTITACIRAKLPDAQVSATSNMPGRERITCPPAPFVLYVTSRNAARYHPHDVLRPRPVPPRPSPLPGERRRDPRGRCAASGGGGLHPPVDGGRRGRRRREQADPLPPLRVEGRAGRGGVHGGPDG